MPSMSRSDDRPVYGPQAMSDRVHVEALEVYDKWGRVIEMVPRRPGYTQVPTALYVVWSIAVFSAGFVIGALLR